VKDKEGHPAFALVNKVTGEAIKHSIAATHPVRYISFSTPTHIFEFVFALCNKCTL
jgi:hypothetical protein